MVEVLQRIWWRLLLGAALATAVLVVLGLVMVHVVDANGGGVDLRVLEWFADHRSTVLNALTRAGTWLAETIPVLVLTLVTLWWSRRRTRTWWAPVFVAAAVGGEKLIYLVTSVLVRRDRPPVETVGDTYATSSWPSGHVGAAITLYGSIALLVAWFVSPRLGRWCAAFAAAAAAVVAFCRMYRGFHYPSDVLAGAVLGAVWLWWCWTVVRPRGAVPHAAEPVESEVDSDPSRSTAMAP